MNAPVRIVSGRIGEVNVTIPWKALIRDNCTVQISGLKLVITPQVFSNYTTGGLYVCCVRVCVHVCVHICLCMHIHMHI